MFIVFLVASFLQIFQQKFRMHSTSFFSSIIFKLLSISGYYLKSWLSLSLLKSVLHSYGTRRFITVFTKARYWTISWARRIQFVPLIAISLRSILILSSHIV